LVEKEVSKC